MDIGFKEINEWHSTRFDAFDGKTFCGYHYIVRRDGTIETGRPEFVVGAHCMGYNTGSLGVVWVGEKRLGDTQRRVLTKLVKDLMLKHGLLSTEDSLFGHCELLVSENKGKTCPNFNGIETFRSMGAFKEIIQTLINLEVA